MTGKQEIKSSYRCHAVVRAAGHIKGARWGVREGFLKEKVKEGEVGGAKHVLGF